MKTTCVLLLGLAAPLLAALPPKPAPNKSPTGPQPVEEWRFETFKAGTPVKGSSGVTLEQVGDVSANSGGADFTGTGLLNAKEDLGKIAGEAFTIVADVEQMAPLKASYGTIFHAQPQMTIRLMGKQLEAACDGEWHAISADASSMPGRTCRVAASYDGSDYKLYLDGHLVGTRPVSANKSGSQFIMIGGRSDLQNAPGEAGESFPGVIKWVKIFDTALTPEQIQALK